MITNMGHDEMTVVDGSKPRVALLVAGILGLSLVTAMCALSRESLENNECYVSVTAREMLQNGNWIMPTFNGRTRLAKTPLSYWLVANVARFTGRVDEFATRLPSAAFAVFSVCAILYFVRQWLSLRVAIVCAGVWLTSLCYIRYSHTARADMSVTFFITLCFLSFYSAITACSRKSQIIYMLVFWVSFGLGNLAKGPMPVPFIVIGLFLYITISRRWGQASKMLPILGPLIFLAIVLPWPLAVAHKVNWDITIWKREFIDRFTGEQMSLPKPFYFYLPQIFIFILPWAAFVPMAIAAPWNRCLGEKKPIMQYLWVVFISGFVFLTLSAGKRQNYLVPLMPIMAIMTGIIVEDAIFERKFFIGRQAKGLLAGHIAAAFVLSIGLVGYCFWRWRQFLPAAGVTAGIIVVMAVAAGVLFSRGRPGLACGGIFTGLVAVIVVIFVGFVNPLDNYGPSKRFGIAVAKMVPTTDKLVSYNEVSPKFIHYVGRIVPEVETESEVGNLYQEGCWIVAFGENIDVLQKTGRYRLVYIEEGADRFKTKPIAGGLFQKQSQVVESAAGPSF